MKKFSIFTTLISIFLFIVTISIGVSAIYSITTFKNYIYEIEREDLVEKTRILHSLFPTKEFDNIDKVREFASAGTNRLTRITIINKDGVVLSDSIKDPETMDNHINRPEIIANREGEREVVLRYSNTLKEMMIYYSIPIKDKYQTVGFLRTAISVESLNNRVKTVTITITVISLILLVVSIIICYVVAINFSVSINSIKKVAGHYARGDFNNSLTERGPRELASLSASINKMGRSLQDRIFTINKQKNRYKSMLESMIEPVIRVNPALIVEEVNPSAENFFNVTSRDVVGFDLLTLTKNNALIEFVKSVKSGKERSIDIIEFITESRRSHLQVHASVLYDGDRNKLGFLLVMNDLTEHVRLEEMRKEFVANVSHELRTPTTAIQGYVETLMNNDVSKEQFDKFLGILYSHSNRLNSIIDDLLVLAGLEKSDGNFTFEQFPVLDLISSIINVVSRKAAKRSIKILVDSSDKHLIYAHPILSEQAITNLITNAIKYSHEGAEVIVKTIQGKYGTSVIVIDNGPGISVEDQHNIFERFYRVDKARSRDQGGTGLGLSIVKRVMNIHNGTATVESKIGQGSMFTLYFPGKFSK